MSDLENLRLRHPTFIALYKAGKLDKVLSRFKDVINKKNYLGGGSHATSYRYKEGKEVLKICVKNIDYFKYFYTERTNSNHSPANEFKKQVNCLGPYLLPIKEILYEDENIFIYTQNLCKRRLEIKKISHEMVVTIFRIVKFLVQKNILLWDLAPNNFGFINKHIVLFDCHDLQPISKNDHQLRSDWWRGMIKNLTRYVIVLYAPEKTQEYVKLMENYNETVYQILRKENLLPSCFLKLLFYISRHPQNVSKEKFLQLLGNCLKFLIERISQPNNRVTGRAKSPAITPSKCPINDMRGSRADVAKIDIIKANKTPKSMPFSEKNIQVNRPNKIPEKPILQVGAKE